MRIVKELVHSRMKITFFQNEGKYSVKFEKRQMEQIYKFRELPIELSFDKLFDVISSFPLSEIEKDLDLMAARQHEWLKAGFNPEENIFPEII